MNILSYLILTFLHLATSFDKGIVIKDCNYPDVNRSSLISSDRHDINECKRSSVPNTNQVLDIFQGYYGAYEPIKKRVRRIVGGRPADPPIVLTDDKDALVFIDDEESDRSAKFTGVSEKNHAVFKGIRYAEPPVKNYRFQRPKRKIPKGEVRASSFGSPCAQYDMKSKTVVGSEDCLFLNVFTPKTRGNELYPVIFWIHGGNFLSGSASQYDPKGLVDKKLVVVTVQYRLGSLGFLGDSSKNLPGNAGLFDIVAALHWTRTYIENFGGDPNKIVVAGQGSGASIASLLGISDFTKDQISGIIAMSGTPVSSFAVDENPSALANNITKLNNCHKFKNSLETVKCMQEIPLQDIIANDNINIVRQLSDENFVTILSKSLSPSAVVEGENDNWFLKFFLNKKPLSSLQKGNFNEVPMMTGVTSHETSTALKGDLKDRVLKVLTDIPQFLDKNLPTSLLNVNTGLLMNGQINNLMSTLFSKLDYSKLLTVKTPSLPGIDKVIQMTTDALYNLPVFLTSTLRSNRSDTFLYSFEHSSPLGKTAAKVFLPNIASVKNDRSNGAASTEVGNGEDLIHLFDVRTLEGKEIDSIKMEDEENLKIRELFTNLVSEFAHTGKPSLKNSKVEWSPFTKENSAYLSIKSKPEVRGDFRFCEMGLWSGIMDRLQSSKCGFPDINNILSTIPTDLWDNSITKNILNVEGLPKVDNIFTGNANPVSGLLNNVRINSQGAVHQSSTRKPANTKPKPNGFLGLGSLFG